jgi:hypothetical protein
MKFIRKCFIWTICAGILLVSACSEKKESKSDTGKVKQENLPGITEQVTGKWLRMDGGYVLHIDKFNADSTLNAVYLNPKPIHISENQWKIQDGYLYFFIKFDDEGYPGSYYSLGYYPEEDKLFGIYYQAVMGQKFDVIFER